MQASYASVQRKGTENEGLCSKQFIIWYNLRLILITLTLESKSPSGKQLLKPELYYLGRRRIKQGNCCSGTVNTYKPKAQHLNFLVLMRFFACTAYFHPLLSFGTQLQL